MWTLMVFEHWWSDIFDSFNLLQPIRLFETFSQGYWLAYCSVLYECIDHTDDTVVRFWNKFFFRKLKLMLGEFNGFFITKQIEKPWPCSVEHSRNGDKHSTTPRVSPYTSFVFQPFPVCFTTEQSTVRVTVKASLLVKYKCDLKFQTMIRRQIFTLGNISW